MWRGIVSQEVPTGDLVALARKSHRNEMNFGANASLGGQRITCVPK